MVKLIMGIKGMGKTKTLIEMVNNSVAAEDGFVVCIEKGTKLRCDINHKARLIDIKEYEVKDFQTFFGFISGLFAGNYDITSIYVDSVLKFCDGTMDELGQFLDKLSLLSANENKNIILTASHESKDVPESVKKYFM